MDCKPCGNHHPLPCGLDVECEVPSEYFEVELSDGEVYSLFLESKATEDGGKRYKTLEIDKSGQK